MLRVVGVLGLISIPVLGGQATVPAPESSTLALMGSGLIALSLIVRRKRK